jgi:hypothetical protein
MPVKPPRALIIAIEEYPKAEGVSKKLEGTNDAAVRFYKWLVETKKVSSSDIAVCAGKELIAGQPVTGTTMADIVEALAGVFARGKDKTSDFFFFYSGHGFCWQKSAVEQPNDVLVASDFRNRKVSGRCCFRFSELRELLWLYLGGSQHFFFTDACRTILKEEEIQVGGLGLALDRAIQGTPEVYTMFSAAVGDAAFTTSGFASALDRGLRGDGHAKGWVRNKMYVKFELLRDYLREKVTAGVEAWSAGPGLIYELGPVQVPCTIVVDDAEPADRFKGSFKTGETSSGFEFEGRSTEVHLAPADRGYEFAVSCDGLPVAQVVPPPETFLDLFEPCSLTFHKGLGEPPPAVPELPFAMTDVSIALPARYGFSSRREARDTSIHVRSPRSGKVTRSRGVRFDGTLPPGDYEAEVRHKGSVLGRHPISVELGKAVGVQLPVATSNWLLDRFLETLPEPRRQSVHALARELGPASVSDVGLWVALMGAAAIVNPAIAEGGFAGLPLLTGQPCAKGQSLLLILAASETGKSCRVSVGGGEKADWQEMDRVQELPGLFRFERIQNLGPQLVSFQLPHRPAWTFSTFGLPNRASLLVLVENAAGNLSAKQFLLPIRDLFRYLDHVVYENLKRQMVRTVRLISWQEARFESREKFQMAKEESANWDALLHAKWLDPLLALIAAHEIVRSGRIAVERRSLATVEANMNRYFRGIPDTLVLSALLRKKVGKPEGPPLLRESLMSLPAFFEALPFPREKLDHDSMWVCWRDAVK